MWTGVFGDEVAQVVWTSCAFTADCLYYLETLDSYGDGWNGASLDIYIAVGTTFERLMILTCLTSGTLRHKLAISLNSNGPNYDSEISYPSFGMKNSFTLAYSETASIRDNRHLHGPSRIAMTTRYDSWGDGWNGAYANVHIDGDFVGKPKLSRMVILHITM